MNASPTNSPWIRDTTDASFAEDVTERSWQVPIVVDFWADWCQPCRLLGPVLERLAVEFEGRFELVKANTEQNALAAAEYHVQSIPAVYGLRLGHVVDGFLGAMPEPEIRRWLERLLPTAAEQKVEAAQLRLVSAPAEAERLLREAMELDPRCDAARIALAELFLEQKRIEECRALVGELEGRGYLEPQAQKTKAALELYDLGREAGAYSDLARRAASQPDDRELQLELAMAMAAEGRYEEALQTGLEVVRKDRGPLRQRAKQLMVDIFRVLPDESELVSTYRRQLAMALY